MGATPLEIQNAILAYLLGPRRDCLVIKGVPSGVLEAYAQGVADWVEKLTIPDCGPIEVGTHEGQVVVRKMGLIQ